MEKNIKIMSWDTFELAFLENCQYQMTDNNMKIYENSQLLLRTQAYESNFQGLVITNSKAQTKSTQLIGTNANSRYLGTKIKS